MKVTLQIDGKKQTFSNVENISTEEENVKSSTEEKNCKVAQKPSEGKWFEVKISSINQKLFEESRDDSSQEDTRKIILEALSEVKKKPEKYGNSFRMIFHNKKDLMECKTALFKVYNSVERQKQFAHILGGHICDWVELALMWAQRITNGEAAWEEICNNVDTANWHRLVVWKNGQVVCLGLSSKGIYKGPESDVIYQGYINHVDLDNSVPYIVV